MSFWKLKHASVVKSVRTVQIMIGELNGASLLGNYIIWYASVYFVVYF